MKHEAYITAIEFCSVNNIDTSFIASLGESGLIELVSSKDELLIRLDQLPVIEKILVLHFDLDINLEGIETILHLLNRTEQMQKEIAFLKNKLSLYEDVNLFNH